MEDKRQRKYPSQIGRPYSSAGEDKKQRFSVSTEDSVRSSLSDDSLIEERNSNDYLTN